ncbi:unnamed protein product [Fasciola hepatica]|uniref:Uncharacterized protein n=1 Tax=Fasciola hepatica TaxID=6192 RepID=A0ABC9HGG6_FASHE
MSDHFFTCNFPQYSIFIYPVPSFEPCGRVFVSIVPAFLTSFGVRNKIHEVSETLTCRSNSQRKISTIYVYGKSVPSS